MRLIIFVVLEVVMCPFQILGVIGHTFRLRRHNIAMGISGTAYEPLFARLFMHDAGTRNDEAAARLAPNLPALSPGITALVSSIGLASRVSGYRGSFFAYPAARPSTLYSMISHRTDFFDQVLGEAVDPDGSHPVGQVVVLGAGWDSRAYGSLAGSNVRVFEVDMPPTQEAKRTALARAGLASDHVTFVETDFDQKSWRQSLSEHGFQADVATFILWEGVTMYLSPEAVGDTLGQVARLAPGSRIAFDFLSRELVRHEAPFEKLGRRIQRSMRYYDEPFINGISTQAPARDHVVELLTSRGLELAAYEPYGEERAGQTPLGGLVLAACRA